MKNIMMFSLLLGMSVNTAFATSYWYDYCHEERVALTQAKKDYPSLNFNGDCDRISELGKPAVITGKIAICEPRITKVQFFGMGNAYYKVKILDPETEVILTYRVIMTDHGGGCKLKKVVELI